MLFMVIKNYRASMCVRPGNGLADLYYQIDVSVLDRYRSD